MRKLRRPKKDAETIKQSNDTLKVDNLESSAPKESFVDSLDIQAIQVRYEAEIEKLKSENKILKNSQSSGATVSKNEEKLLSAIRSERLIQENDWPIIGRAKFKNVYKINPKYLDKSISNLLNQKQIERKKVKYSEKISTFSWRILD